MSIPHLFRCPISLDLFTDPVTLSTGQTYDRPSIERWLAAGNLTCPVTMQRLHDPTLVPNHTLRHLIDHWLLSGAGRDPREPRLLQSSGICLANLRRTLQSTDAAFESRLECLGKIRALSVESDTGRSCLIRLGFFPLLLQLLFQGPCLEEFELIEIALDCVLSLSPSTQLGHLDILKHPSNLRSMVNLLGHGNAKIRASLCCLIEVAADNLPSTEDLCLLIGQTRPVMKILISILNGKHPLPADAAARAVSGLCSLELNMVTAIEGGVVDGLIAYLSSSSKTNVAAKALATVEQAAMTEEGKRAVARNPCSIRTLVKMVFRVSSSDEGGSERAVGALLAVCRGSARAGVEAVNAGVLSQLLLLLQSQCGSKAKGRARALLKLLSSMWGDDEACHAE